MGYVRAGIAGRLSFFEGRIQLALVAGLCISSIYVELAGNATIQFLVCT